MISGVLRSTSRVVPWALALAPLLEGCSGCRSDPKPGADAAAVASATSPPAADSAAAGPRPVAPVREGGAIVRAATDDALYIADEDHNAVRRVALPFPADAPTAAFTTPGPPAQVLTIADRVLVTIRNPGLLLILKPTREEPSGLALVAKVALPADAWGIAITPDERTALVSSAWTHQVSAVDLATATKRWSVDVAREPRGIVIRSDGQAAYVTHLVGAALTRIDGLDGVPKARKVTLPAAPIRAPFGATLDASLGYAAALSPDGKRLFVARHALGAIGADNAWFGAATVDVLWTPNDTPLAPERAIPDGNGPVNPRLIAPEDVFLQPRAVVYRKATRTLLIASEGEGLLTELDALSLAPAAIGLSTRESGDPVIAAVYGDTRPGRALPEICGAPAGVALSADEMEAYIFCRSTYELARVPLHVTGEKKSDPVRKPPVKIRLADDPLPPDAAKGRRLFYDATDKIVSGGLACAACHPDGRDDGHVWHEVTSPKAEGPIFAGGPDIAGPGLARQTPMLAGRVSSEGPYGWHGQNATLGERVREGLHLHRWDDPPGGWKSNEMLVDERVTAIGLFVRKGLVPPPRDAHEPTPEEKRGKELFVSAATGCAGCHVPETEFTHRIPVNIPEEVVAEEFDHDPNKAFKTPSLLFVSETAPYFHDGRYRTLEELIEKNDDRMGKTRQLSKEERAAMVAYLKTL